MVWRSRIHDDDEPPGSSGPTDALILAGSVSASGLLLRLVFLLAPVRVSDAISGALGTGVFGIVVILLGFGLACLVWRTK